MSYMKKLVLMFSGGLDSTAALWLLLTKPEYENYDIHVHHVNIKNSENRNVAEAIATKQILEWFKKNGFREFGYTESVIGYHRYNGKILMDVDVTCFFAGYIASSVPGVELIAFGFTKDDFDDPTFVPGRLDRAKKIFECFSDASLFSPIEDYEKSELYEVLPEELRELTWSCRLPRYENGIPIKCGRCKPCYQLRNIKPS